MECMHFPWTYSPVNIPRTVPPPDNFLLHLGHFSLLLKRNLNQSINQSKHISIAPEARVATRTRLSVQIVWFLKYD